MNPKITIGIPTYSRSEWLKDAVDSILKQSYQNIEIIVVDDKSIDGTQAVMLTYTKQYSNIKYIRHEENIGQVANFCYLNKVLTGDYVMVLCDDDYLLDRDFLREAVELMEEHKNVSMVRGIEQDFRVDDNRILFSKYIYKKITSGKEYFLNYGKSEYTPGIYTFCALLRGDLFRKVGGLDHSHATDVTVMFKLMLDGDVGFINRVGFVVRMRAVQYSVNRWLFETDLVKSNFDIVNRMVAMAKEKNCFNEVELTRWRYEKLFEFFFGFEFDLQAQEVAKSLEFIKNNCPDVYAKARRRHWRSKLKQFRFW